IESVTFPSASLVTLPRCDKSPRATWLMTLSNSVMLRSSASLASWLLVALDTLATARFRFSAMYPSSSFEVTSARARGSPAAIRSENSARACTGPSIAPNRHARITAVASASTMAMSTVPPAGEPKSNKDASPAFFPALKASPRTTKTTTPFSRTSVQIVELSRDFMPPSKSLPRSPRHASALSPQISNARARKNLKQPAQIDHQRQAVVMPQHSDAMRQVFRRLLEQILGVHRIGSDHFVGGDADPNVLVMFLGSQGSDHHVLGQQSWPASFRNRNVYQRHDGAAQIEYSDQVCRAKGELCQQRPIQHFLDIQNRKAEPLAPAAEDAILRLRRPLFDRPKRFEQIAGIGVRRKGFEVEVFAHRFSLAQKLLCEPPHCAQQIFPCEWLRQVSVCALLLAPILIARGVL